MGRRGLSDAQALALCFLQDSSWGFQVAQTRVNSFWQDSFKSPSEVGSEHEDSTSQEASPLSCFSLPLPHLFRML